MKRLSISFSKIVPLTAGTITISNFLLSVIPIASASETWKSIILQGISPEFRFIIFFLFALLFAYTITKIIVTIDRQEAMPSTKIVLISLLCACYAWIIVFNIKVIALGNSIEGWNSMVFLVSAFLFSIYLSINLHFDFKSLQYPNYGDKQTMIWNAVDEGFYTPKYIRNLRFLIYWFVVILGVYFYKF